ncbi:MAG: nidogen-like domain-containing protein, partial [Phycisphaerae bacterium]
GSFTDADGNIWSEHFLVNEPILAVPGDPSQFELYNGRWWQKVAVEMPDGLSPVTSFARFRFTSGAPGDDPSYDVNPPSYMGVYPDGEVEDYQFSIVVGDAAISGWKFDDRNADGVWDIQGTSTRIAPVTLAPFGSGQQVLMSGRDSDGQLYTDVVPNDDLSSGLLDLGFSFEFFGNTYTQFYVNNNGNITFESPLGRFIPQGFGQPASPPIVAPFWSDVDTRVDTNGNAGGEVRMATGTSPAGNPFVQIDWVDVGYYDRTVAANTDARNAFTLYIEDDPQGDVVVFDYSSMEWTTGGVSGTDGFGGLGAQIGFDAGDATNYISLMRPNSTSTLSDLLQIEQYSFRINPATGTPVEVEPGMAGVFVYLDLNDNGLRDTDQFGVLEPATITAQDNLATPGVDETGYYEFNGLFAGTYVVREILPDSELVQTYPNATAYVPAGMLEIRAVAPDATLDGKWFSVGDGTDTVVFEFDTDGDGNPLSPNVVLNVSSASGADAVAAIIAGAIGGEPSLDLTASAAGEVVTITANAGATVQFSEGNTPLVIVSSSTDVDANGGFYTVKLD